MEQNRSEDNLTLDSYIKTVKDQEIKGILLKLKNEIRREDSDKSIVDALISSLKERNENTAKTVLELIKQEG